MRQNSIFFKQIGVNMLLVDLFNYACHILAHMFLCKSATEEAGMKNVCDDPLLGGNKKG